MPEEDTRQKAQDVRDRGVESPDEKRFNILRNRRYVLDEGEKQTYRMLIEEETLDALEKFAGERGEKGKEIHEEILGEHNKNKDRSLFELIHERILRMKDEEFDGKKETVDGLLGVRKVLTDIAKDVGVFDSLNEEIKKAQATGDWGFVKRAVGDIEADKLDDFATGTTPRYNRTSVHFGGMNEAYKEGAMHWMRYAELGARALIAKDNGRDQEARRFEERAVEYREKEVKYKTWGKSRTPLIWVAYEKLKKVEKRSLGEGVRSGEIEEAVERGFTKGLEKRELLPEKRYDIFLERERWAEGPFEIDFDQPPNFYLQMNRKEQREFEARVNLLLAMRNKRLDGWSLGGAAKNTILNSFTKEETALLYRMPGVQQALEFYVTMIDHPNEAVFTREDGSTFTIVDSEDRADSEMIRRDVAEWVYKHLLREGLSENEAKQKAYEAEQVAFNLHFVGNFFERDSRWVLDERRITGGTEKIIRSLAGSAFKYLDREWIWGKGRKTGVRIRGPKLANSDFCHAPLRAEMAPMDTLVDNTLKSKKKRPLVGGLSEWAAIQTQKSLKLSGIREISGFDEVVIIDETIENNDKYWTVEDYRGADGRKRHRLYAPRCYPITNIGSIWEETKLGVGGIEKSLLDYLRERVEIPWDMPGAGSDMWSGYVFDLGKEDVIWGAYKRESGKGIQTEAFRNAIARRGKGDPRMLRWLIKIEEGINERRREPTFYSDDETARKVIYSRWSSVLRDREESRIFHSGKIKKRKRRS